MKKLMILLVLIAFAFSSCHVRKIAQQNPPGTLLLSVGLYYDQTEITNLDWNEFLYWTQRIYGDSSEEYRSILPKDFVIDGLHTFPMEDYLRHPAWRNYPVVNISYDQAVAYCQWRSDRVNERIYLLLNKDVKFHADSVYKNVPEYYSYRLPTREEYLKIATEPLSKRNLKKSAKSDALPYNCEKDFEIHKITRLVEGSKKREHIRDSLVYPYAPAQAYWPNQKGAYNLRGNVAEMISEKGIAMGGSYKDQRHSIVLGRESSYTHAESWLGFRCVCEKKQEIKR